MALGGHNADYKGGRIERVDLSSGKVERLYETCDGKRLHSPNDIVFDSHGGFYFTDVGHDGENEHGPFRWSGGVYYAKTDGSSITCVVPRVTSANGVGLSPDGKTLYFADTGSCRSFGVPVTGPGQLDLGPDWRGNYFLGTYRGAKGAMFDSLGVQADGGVCIATLQVGGITTFGPGDRYRFDQMPGDPFVTNICWGGKDMKTAYVTLSGVGKVLAVDWPTPGLRLNYNA
jgi:gluconolactonase